jgi:dTDP-4-dehydrorhamnose reductase
MSALIGSTGFVGGHLQNGFSFKHKYNRSNISDIHGLETDLLVCAGLPAEKWKANSEPDLDWANMAALSQVITTVKADKAILISTIDVFQPAIDVTERSHPDLIGFEAYGRHRAWFEILFRATYPESLIIRLPGLFAQNLKKNFIYDLINHREEHYTKIDGESMFQFFDITRIAEVIEIATRNKLTSLNVATSPLSAQNIADIFNVQLTIGNKNTNYRMKSDHDHLFGGVNGYLYNKEELIQSISMLHLQDD